MDAAELRESFQNLKVGDIFHGTYPGLGGRTGSAICLVTDLDTTTIKARTITTHWHLIFDRATLADITDNERSVVTVTSTKKLPNEIYKVMLEIDRKYDPSNPVRDPTLTRAQRDALILVTKHYEMCGKI
jgi:hypothetical protein